MKKYCRGFVVRDGDEKPSEENPGPSIWPEEGEDREEFIARCVDELTECIGAEAAEGVCETKWEKSKKLGKDKDWRAAMPMKPRKGESQSDFTSRCVPEMMGPDKDKRPQEQAVAICLDIWRQAHGGEKPKSADMVQKIIARWCEMLKKQDFMDLPDPDDDEDKQDYIDRCVDELSDQMPDMDVDEAEQHCEMKWEEEQSNGDDNDDEDKSGEDGIIHKQHVAAATDKLAGGLEFILSDATPDRYGDIVDPKGWEFKSFLRHPIALFNHNADAPIGIWKNIRIDGETSLRGGLVLAPAGTSPRIDEIRKLVEVGILKAVSVGFKSIKSEPLSPDNGRDPFGFGPKRYLKQELVECSLVSIPANPNALAVAKSLRISPETQRLVFGKHADNKTRSARRGEHASERHTREKTGEHARTNVSQRTKDMTISLSKRITDVQERIVTLSDELTEHLGKLDDTNVSETDMQASNDLNAKIAQARKTLATLQDAEKQLGTTAGGDNGGGSNRSLVIHDRRTNGSGGADGNGLDAAEIERRKQFFQATSGKKDLQPLDYLIRAGVVTLAQKLWNRPPEVICRDYAPYSDEKTRAFVDWNIRAAANPAMTTVTGWAAELVQTIYGPFMDLLYPKSIYPRLSAKGLSMQFGRAGKIIVPTRAATPTIAGSFVGEGAAIPVRAGQFTSYTLTPKKMAVISSWTKEMDEHSIPAIEGILRDAIQTDTGIALDSVLIDANPATAIRPAGLLNGVAALTPTAGSGFPAIVGDLKQLTNALVVATKGNIRNPVMLINPGDMNSARYATFPNAGWAFRDEINGGTLGGFPLIDSGTVPSRTVAVVDAADFVTAGEEAPRFEVSDQATLHEEDTTPLPIVPSGGSASSPVRSLWQTDSLALRLIYRVNWVLRRTGIVAWVQNVNW